MLTCSHCDRVLLWGCLEAMLDESRQERRSIRVCSVSCCEALGHMDGLVRAWIYQARPVAERRSA